MQERIVAFVKRSHARARIKRSKLDGRSERIKSKRRACASQSNFSSA
jgi:hypothetical protein